MLSSAISKANKTTLCASDEIPSDYLLAVAPHNTNSMIILYTSFALLLLYDHSAPTVNQPKDQLNQFSGHSTLGNPRTGQSSMRRKFWSEVSRGKIRENQCSQRVVPSVLYTLCKQTKKQFFCFSKGNI